MKKRDKRTKAQSIAHLARSLRKFGPDAQRSKLLAKLAESSR